MILYIPLILEYLFQGLAFNGAEPVTRSKTAIPERDQGFGPPTSFKC